MQTPGLFEGVQTHSAGSLSCCEALRNPRLKSTKLFWTINKPSVFTCLAKLAQKKLNDIEIKNSISHSRYAQSR